jgi:hypothetical protein
VVEEEEVANPGATKGPGGEEQARSRGKPTRSEMAPKPPTIRAGPTIGGRRRGVVWKRAPSSHCSLQHHHCPAQHASASKERRRRPRPWPREGATPTQGDSAEPTEEPSMVRGTEPWPLGVSRLLMALSLHWIACGFDIRKVPTNPLVSSLEMYVCNAYLI